MIDLDRELRDYAELMEQAMGPIHVEAFRAANPAHRRPSRRGLTIALAAAALMILVLAVVVLLDPFGSDGPFIEEPPTASTTTAPTVTEAVPPTTSTAVEDTTISTATTPVAAPPVPVITWTRVFGEGQFEEIQAVAVIDSGYIAVGNDQNADALVLRSSDGVNWERVADDGTVFGGEGFQGGYEVAARSDVIVVVGNNGPSGDERPLVWTSTDAGATWQRIELEGKGRAWAVTVADDRFVAGGDGIWTSADGVDWRPVANDADAFGIVSVVRSPIGFVAFGNSDHQAAAWTSQDGEMWQRVPHDDGLFGDSQPTSGSTWIHDAIATPDGFIAVGVSHNKPTVWTSQDGFNWSRTNNQPAAKGGYQPINAVTRAGPMLVAVGFHQSANDTQTALAYVSLDEGQTWRTPTGEGNAFGAPTPGQIYAHDVVADGTRLVAVGYRNDEAAVWIATIEE